MRAEPAIGKRQNRVYSSNHVCVSVPSTDTFFPSMKPVSMRRRPQWREARTDSKLDFCWPAGRGSKGPAAIEGCTVGRPPQRPDHLLPQHLEALNDGEGLGGARLELTFTMDAPSAKTE